MSVQSTARTGRSDGLRRILKWQWRFHPLAFAGGILVSFVPAAAGLALLGVSGWFITAAAIAGATGVFLNVMTPSAIIRGLALARTFGRYGERLVTHDATFRFLADLRCRIFTGQANQAGNGRVWRSAGLLGRLTADVAALDGVYLRLAVPTVLSAGIGLMIVVICLWLAPVTVSGPVLALAGAAAASGYLVRNRHARAGRRLEAGQEALRVRTVDLVAGRRDLAIYGGLKARSEAVLAADARIAEAEVELHHKTAGAVAWGGFAQQMAVALTLVLATVEVTSGALSLPQAVGLVLLVLGLPDVLNTMINGYTRIGAMARAAGRAVAQEPEQQLAGPSQSGTQSGKQSGGTTSSAVLALENVGFSYPGAERAVLGDFSLSVEPGEWVCIIGPSGCGKSTVSALASGVLDPGTGRVTLAGQAMGTLGEDELRRRITVIGQRPALFNDTIAANLRIANPDATDEDLWQALAAAALDERIARQPTGLSTVLGEGGLGLSGGEQRRLGLARAYLTRPEIFILDELTEGLDPQTAESVLDRFAEFRGNAAVLMIAHKPEEVRRADRVVELERF